MTWENISRVAMSASNAISGFTVKGNSIHAESYGIATIAS
jgi:hypothetical protein